MAKRNHLKKIREGVEIWNAYVEKQRARDTDFRSDLSHAKLREANLIGASLKGANLIGVDLEGADLEWANLKGADLEEANLGGADLERANLTGTNLIGASLKGANLIGVDLEGADIEGAILKGADLEGANLEGADLERANLTGANLEEANLEGANLTRANLYRADLRGAGLFGANLEEADLRGAGLFRADLRGAGLFGADLRGAGLFRADVRSVTKGDTNGDGPPLVTDLTAVKNLSQVQLDTMLGDDLTKIPKNLTRPEHWGKFEAQVDDAEVEDEVVGDQGTQEAAIDAPEINISKQIFLSYSSDDRATVEKLKDTLEARGIPFWWDQELRGGDGWREKLDEYIQSAAGVLTLWTPNSVKSHFVLDESERARKSRKLVPVILEKAELPLGFGGIQTIDISRWNGKKTAAEIDRVVTALEYFLSPRSAKVKAEALSKTSKTVWIPSNGALVSDNQPPGPAELDDPTELNQRIDGLKDRVEVLCTQIEKSPRQFDKEHLDDLVRHYGEALQHSPLKWFVLDDRIGDIRDMMRIDKAEEGWPDKVYRPLLTLLKRHKEIAPFLRAKEQSRAKQRKAEAQQPLASVQGMDSERLFEISGKMMLLSRAREASIVLDDASLNLFASLSHGLNVALEVAAFDDRERDANATIILGEIVKSTQRFSNLALALEDALSQEKISDQEAGERLGEQISEILDALLKFYE